MSIVVNGLSKVYGQQKAIDDISFSAEKGQIIGLLGPNGAGKTTTMKILTCYMPPTSGTATLSGLEIGKDDHEIKKLIGYLPEHNPLYGTMYVKEYLRFVERVHKLPRNANRIPALIDRVGLTIESNKKIGQLSKGYRQRVGIAQALIHEPEILILDEPISGLDPNQLVEIRALISELKKDKTVIFSSHILQEVESISDKIIILDKGRIVADDALSNLASKSSNNTVISIELLNDISEEILRKVSGVRNVQKVESKSFVLDSNFDNREQIFDTVAASGNKLLGMKVETQSLESVFKSFTNKRVE